MSKKTKTDECILQVKMNIPATGGGGRDLPRPKRWLRERCTSPVQGQAHNMRQNDAQAGITLGPLLREAAVAAGIDNPDEISLHALRRSFAQIAYELGCTLEEIANAIGNTAAIVERHYVNTAISPIARRVNGMVNERRMG